MKEKKRKKKEIELYEHNCSCEQVFLSNFAYIIIHKFFCPKNNNHE